MCTHIVTSYKAAFENILSTCVRCQMGGIFFFIINEKRVGYIFSAGSFDMWGIHSRRSVYHTNLCCEAFAMLVKVGV